MTTLAIVGLGGCCGAISRYLLSVWVQRLTQSSFPYGTLAVNLIGCFALGVLMRLVLRGETIPPEWRTFIATGFLGSLTTFSTFGYETVALLEKGNYTAALAAIAANLLIGLSAVILGQVLVDLVVLK